MILPPPNEATDRASGRIRWLCPLLHWERTLVPAREKVHIKESSREKNADALLL
jgi:hypothetical protein